MSWLDKLIQPVRQDASKRRRSMPEGVWQQCVGCSAAIFEDTFAKNLCVCDKCGYHHHMLPARRAAMVFDAGTEAREIGTGIRSKDFLKFTDIRPYSERLKKLTADDPGREALRAYVGSFEGRPLVVACFDFTFMGGSMGSVVGERFMLGIEESADLGAPFVVFTSSGGARMQEGLTSLMQMAKTVCGRSLLAVRSIPFVSVLCNPTLGGVAASFALVADVIIAEPGAKIGFAGARVISETVGEKLPEGFQSSEFLLKHGGIDMVVHRRVLRVALAKVIGMLAGNGTAR